MDYILLKEEILNGSLAAELLGKNDDEAAIILNEKRFTKNVLVPLSDIQVYLMQENVWWDIVDAGTNSGHPAYYVCRRALDYFTSNRVNNIDLSLQFVQQLSGGLVQAGILSQDHFNHIFSMGTIPASRADVAGFGSISPDQINTARRA